MKRQFKNFVLLFISILVTAICFTGCKQEDEEKYLVRETDSITFDSNLKSSKTITLRCNGEWHAVIPDGAEWVSFVPEKGVGNGSFENLEVVADDNRGAERETTVYLECAGVQYPIKVKQADGQIIYSDVAIVGSLKHKEISEAKITVNYNKAFGDEKVTVSGKIEGGVSGIAIDPTEINLQKGNGQLSVDIKGTPASDGDISILISINDKEIGSIKTTVLKADELPVEGLPVSWNFSPIKGTADDVSALKAAHPEWLSKEHYCGSDAGSGRLSIVEATGKTATAVNGWGFNDGHLYLKGLYLDDYILFSVPVKNFKANTKLKFKGSIGGSGSAAAFFMIEYSTDKTNWTQAEGAQTGTFNDKTFDYHIQAVDATTTVGDNCGNFDKTFSIKDAVENGTIYIRMRVCANVRVSLTSTITNTGGGSNRIKGVTSISIVE